MRGSAPGGPVLRRVVATVVAALAAAAVPAPAAHAFDTGPHADMTRDALTAEGFTAAAASIGVVDNFFVDYYTNPDQNPYSGHAGALIGVTRLKLDREDWLQQWVAGARALHFDYTRRQLEQADLSNVAGIEREWDRLEFHTRRLLRDAAERNSPHHVLSAIGQSLHAVQDFYSHSNWVEDPSDEPGRGGPGISRLGFGDTPTWFDVPPEVRRTLQVYTGVTGVPRGHGHWRSNDNRSLHDGLNKDWPGRPKFDEAYITAYFASRQWIRAMRTWLGNEPLWRRAMAMRHTRSLDHDLEGAEKISWHTGHWQGGGEPCVPFSCGVRTGKAGSIVSLRLALGDFHDRGPTPYRRAFNDHIAQWALFPADIPEYPDLPSSRTDQVFTRFVKLEVLRYDADDLGDPVGGADVYARARIAGQPYASTVINGADDFRFPRPYAPFTWFRSLPVQHRASTPVESMHVRIKTGDRRFAGTDDNVYLRIGRHRFSLEKRAYNDFERGDDDTYAVPIGSAARDGFTIGDITRVAIEKSRDGVAGGWFLEGVTLFVNGRVLVSDRRINRWLEDNHRTWTAPRFTRDHRTQDIAGVWLELYDDDFGPNDTGDLHPYDRNTAISVGYRLGTVHQRAVRGGHRYRGRLSMQNGDRASLTYRLTTRTVVPPPPPVPPPPEPPPPVIQPDPGPAPPPPPPGPRPDLVIAGFDGSELTVRNQGAGAAGPFSVSVTRHPTLRIEGGLAPGASVTRTWRTFCDGNVTAFADSGSEVAESDETNNAATSPPVAFC